MSKPKPEPERENENETNSRIRDRFLSFAAEAYIIPVSGISLLILIFHGIDNPPIVDTLRSECLRILLFISYILYGIRLNYSLSALNKQKAFWDKWDKKDKKKFTFLDQKLDDILKGILTSITGVVVIVFFTSKIAYEGRFFEVIFLTILLTSVAWEYLIHRRFSKLLDAQAMKRNTITEALSSWFKSDLLLILFLVLYIIFSSIDVCGDDYSLVAGGVFLVVNLLLFIEDIVKNWKLIWKEKLSLT